MYMNLFDDKYCMYIVYCDNGWLGFNEFNN